MRARTLSFLAATWLMWSTAARAEPDEGRKLVARELIGQGRAAREAQDYRAALESFSKAHAIMHVPTTLLELARAHVDLGELVEAERQLAELAELPPSPGEPEPFARARAEAQTLALAIAARIPRLRVDLNGSPSLGATELFVDGASHPECANSCQLNPGRHVVVARTNTAQAMEQVQLAEHDSQAVELVFSPVRSHDARQIAVTASSRSSTTYAIPTSTWIFGGIALAGVGVGTALGIGAVQRRDELLSDCAPHCSTDDVDGVRRRALLANISFGVSASAAALAVVTYVLNRPAKEPDRNAGWRVDASADPRAGNGYVSLRGGF